MERQLNLNQIAETAEAIVSATKECSGSQLSETLGQLKALLRKLAPAEDALEAALVREASGLSSHPAPEELVKFDHVSEADETAHPEHELSRLVALFPAIDAAQIEDIVEEAGSVDTAKQLLMDISGASDTIESEEATGAASEDPDSVAAPEPEPDPPTPAADLTRPVSAPAAPAPAPVPLPAPDPAPAPAPAEGAQPDAEEAEPPLPGSASNLSEALDMFIKAQHVNEVDHAWRAVRSLSGVAPEAQGLEFFAQLKEAAKSRGRSQALQVLEILDTKLTRREQFRKLAGHRVAVIGAGPVGLRCAIELAMCGADVMVIEQRRTFTRANILKLWPFLVHDLRGLGAKIFFPHYCTGGLMHIGTRRLQQILLKDALLLGVDVRYGLQFHRVTRPDVAAGKPNWGLELGPMMRGGKPRDPPELYAAAQAEAAEVAARAFDSVFIGIGQQAAVETEADGKTRLTFPPVVEGEEAAPLFELKKVQYSQALGLVTHFKNNSKMRMLSPFARWSVANLKSVAISVTAEENTIQEQVRRSDSHCRDSC